MVTWYVYCLYTERWVKKMHSSLISARLQTKLNLKAKCMQDCFTKCSISSIVRAKCLMPTFHFNWNSD